MKNENILEALKLIEIDINGLEDTTDFKADLGMDSQEIVEFHCMLEKLYEKKLPDSLIRNAMTVGELSEKLESLIKQG